MSEMVTADLCVIGAGSGGLTVAAGASQLGASVVLIEKGRMGGDCLNFGCVPSKSLIAAARAAETVRQAGRFGIGAGEPRVDFARVRDHVHGVIQTIAANDSVERFEGLGVRVIRDTARFTGPREIAAGDKRVRARRFVIATGSSPAAPPIPGIEDVPYLTNETIFDNSVSPNHLIVIGGGPVGVELAQAHRRLGVKVTLLEMFTILAGDDPELVDIVRTRLRADGVELREGAAVEGVEQKGKGVAVTVAVARDETEERIEGSHLLVAAGRRANVDGLGLEAAGVEYGPGGVTVDARLRTTNRRIFAIGDAAGGPQFTHMASYHAGIVLRNALFRLPAKVDPKAVPRVTYCDPPLAHVGMDEVEAAKAHRHIRVLRWPFHENDRAQTEHQTDGLIKVVTTRGGRVLGASIVGARAGDLIQLWILAVGRKVKLGDIAQMIAPYPTFGEVSKRAAASYYTPKLFSRRTRRIVRFLGKFG